MFSRLSRPLLEGLFADELAPLQPTPGSSMNSTGRASWRLQNAFWRVPLTCGCRRHSKALTETDVVRPFRISHRGGPKILIDPFLSDNPSWHKGWIGSRAGEDSTQGGGR